MVEHRLPKPVVAGSIPVSRSRFSGRRTYPPRLVARRSARRRHLDSCHYALFWCKFICGESAARISASLFRTLLDISLAEHAKPRKAGSSRRSGMRYLHGFFGSHIRSGPPSAETRAAAASVLSSVAPQTTLVASGPLPVLEPQTTLKAVSRSSFQGSGLLHTTELPLTLEPQMVDHDHCRDEPQITERAGMLLFPFTRETVPFDWL